ncbi:bifunctional 2-polyprenyl-6-hydroxyphenol methylase/3-demethylubiquinol 3-O-methyltransferase UbiG [Chroococcidiopsis sp. TS-821]|uniref:class I SAM-dependent methyltransferase n=1 Tax=Chroococcidiopsis sp. TS-821 TaxID=1378066 RepID=UPI000CEEA3C3|nr:class I SAM-dependent methyltransferase [Chroococcidiopsis sp. TS-821]PPS41574.1 type 11 methyltransferase [Chroococcidiopsis sp. TS-821]
MHGSDLVLLRKTHFQKLLPLNQRLINLSADLDSHAFLKNPASQNIYLYLTDYVSEFSSKWFKRSLDSLKILDWGCGKGFITFLLKEIGACVTSCDVPGNVDSAFGQSTPILEAELLEVTCLDHPYLLPFEKESFDVVLSFGVLEHVPNDLESLREIHRILRRGGLFFCFFLPYCLSWTQRLAHLRGDFYHDRLYSKKQVKQLLAKSHFQLLDIWHRQLFPKNRVAYANYHQFELLDQWLTEKTPLKYIATNIEFVAHKV